MRILYVTTISLTVNSFFKPHIDMLVKEGHTVEIACNARELPLDPFYTELGCAFHQIDFSRSRMSRDHIKAYGQLKRLVAAGAYDIVHCHTPNASVITRLVCRRWRKKTGLRVFYTAHGFHFFKGASKLNWMIYYPIEKLCARMTDKLITINREDYALAKRKFKAGKVLYVPGVGIDPSKFSEITVDRAEKRRSLGIPEDAKLILSVGELNENKNHRLVIGALSQMSDARVHYAIAGDGPLAKTLCAFADECGIADRVHLLGYRSDIAELYRVADVFCHPSLREGLPVSLMEAMACGLPVACSRIRGNADLIHDDGGALFDPRDGADCRHALEAVLGGDLGNMGDVNRKNAQRYSVGDILAQMKSIYES